MSISVLYSFLIYKMQVLDKLSSNFFFLQF